MLQAENKNGFLHLISQYTSFIHHECFISGFIYIWSQFAFKIRKLSLKNSKKIDFMSIFWDLWVSKVVLTCSMWISHSNQENIKKFHTRLHRSPKIHQHWKSFPFCMKENPIQKYFIAVKLLIMHNS